MAIPRFWVLTKENLKFEINLFWIAMVLAPASGRHKANYMESTLNIHNPTYFLMVPLKYIDSISSVPIY